MYPKRYVDRLVDKQGNLFFARDELDAIMPGLLLFTLDERFGERWYGIALHKLRSLFDTLNRTTEGAFWHKDKYPYQMWLDGLYMGVFFALRYAEKNGDANLAPMVVSWEKQMRTVMSDKATGLLYHAWDEGRKASWSNPATGNSLELWGRSLGWYGHALSQFIDILPENDAAQDEWKSALGRFLEGLVRHPLSRPRQRDAKLKLA